MIPYWPQPVWVFGSLKIHAFGLVEALALIAGYALVVARTRKAGLDERRVAWLFIAMLIVGLAVGWAVGGTLEQPAESAAGVIGGVIVVALAAWLRFGSSVLPLLDVMASATPVTAAIARFGCFLAHDHRGGLSTGLFSVRFPEGARNDIGLFECVLALMLAGPIWWYWRSRPAPGMVTLLMFTCVIAMRIASAFQ